MDQDSKQSSSSGESLSLNIVLFIGLFVQGCLYYEYCLDGIGLSPILLSVLLLTAVLIVHTFIRAHYQADVRYHILSCVFVFFLGPLGTFVALLGTISNIAFSCKFKGNFSDWIFNRLLAAASRERKSDKIYNRIVSGQEALTDKIDTEPLIDIMEFGSIRQKQEALVKVVKYFYPHLAPVLRMGLNDPDNAIRVQAAAALAKLQDDFHKEYTVLGQKIRGEAKTAEELVSFAKICEDYSNSGLMNTEGKSAELKEIITVFERAVKDFPDNLEMAISLMRMHLVNRDNDRLNELLTGILPHVRNPKPAICDTLMELLFKMNRFAEMRSYAREWMLQEKNSPENAVSDKIEFWSDSYRRLNGGEAVPSIQYAGRQCADS